MSNIKDFGRDKLMDGVLESLKSDLDDIFADELIAAQMKKTKNGKQLAYNLVFIANMSKLVNSLKTLSETSEVLLAAASTEKILDAFRIVIDGIDETFKAKDKELKAVK